MVEEGEEKIGRQRVDERRRRRRRRRGGGGGSRRPPSRSFVENCSRERVFALGRAHFASRECARERRAYPPPFYAYFRLFFVDFSQKNVASLVVVVAAAAAAQAPTPQRRSRSRATTEQLVFDFDDDARRRRQRKRRRRIDRIHREKKWKIRFSSSRGAVV